MSSVLVADDWTWGSNSFLAFLRDEGHDVVATPVVDAALALLDAKLPGMLLVRLMASELDSMVLLEHLGDQPRWRAVPIVLLLAASDTRCIASCRQLEARGYRVSATFSGVQMMDEVRRCRFGPDEFEGDDYRDRNQC